MWVRLGVDEADWRQTPETVREAVTYQMQRLDGLEQRCSLYEEQIALLRAQVAEVEKLKAEIAELRELVKRNSSNSSKPPSSDPPYLKKYSSKREGKRKRGGQKGRKGIARNLVPEEEVSRIINVRPISCQQCGGLLLGDDSHPERHQVSEVPVVKARVTEYRRHRIKCVVCGAMNQPEWPEDMPRGSFGARAQAIVAYLSGRMGVSQRDICEAMAVLHGLRIGLGSVSVIEERISAALEQPVKVAYSFVKKQAVNYVDETGWKEQNKNCWLWLAASKAVTVFRIMSGRGSAQAREIIRATEGAIITSDRHHAYNWLGLSRRQICWAHLRRDFQAIAERGGDSEAIGQGLLDQTNLLFELWHKARDGTISRIEFEQQMQPVQQRVGKLLRDGRNSANNRTRRTCANIVLMESALWTFVRVEGVEPTNNNAERPLRRAVLWRRKSFGTQSEAGSRFVERILTAVTTLRQQGCEVLDYLTAVQSHDPTLRPSLVPETAF
jgi:transposase